MVPKLWRDTVDAHRRDLRAAVMDAAWQLATDHGVLGVTMGEVAERAGIGRATLYKYFGGVEEILVAAHTRHVGAHLAQLDELRSSASSPCAALHSVLEGYAQICFHRDHAPVPDLRGLVHGGDEFRQAQGQVVGLLAHCVRDAQAAGDVRTDIAADELAPYCFHALSAAGGLPSKAAVARLIEVVKTGLQVRVR